MSDARSVSTDALETLGTILTTPQKRDAIHLAVEPVIAGDSIMPGEDILIDFSSGQGIAHPAPGRGKGIGIADPFIKRDFIEKGECFWYVMYPRQVKSLRHVWEHPAFPEGK
jgi:hypothetical protein